MATCCSSTGDGVVGDADESVLEEFTAILVEGPAPFCCFLVASQTTPNPPVPRARTGVKNSRASEGHALGISFADMMMWFIDDTARTGWYLSNFCDVRLQY